MKGKTKYCNENCKSQKYLLHDAICLYKRRDAGEFRKITMLCKYCSKPILRKINNSWGKKNFFCSKECNNKYNSKHRNWFGRTF